MTREKGFTLIELLIVAAIIGILAAIVIPVFIRASAQETHQIQTEQRVEQAPKPLAKELFASGRVHLIRFCDPEENKLIYIAHTSGPEPGSVSVAIYGESDFNCGE